MARFSLVAGPLAASALLGLAGAASAQSAAPPTNLDGKPGTLSDKLGDTNGVIRPEGNVDPAMHKATPPTGTMPVIKPGQVPPQDGAGEGKGGTGNGSTGTGKGGLY
jgi:hypothetical protein